MTNDYLIIKIVVVELSITLFFLALKMNKKKRNYTSCYACHKMQVL